MPDIFKTQEFVEIEDSVQIPDVALATPYTLDEESLEGQDALEGNGEDLGEDGVPVPHISSAQRVNRPFNREEVEQLFSQELEELRRSAHAQAYSDAIQQKRGEIKDCISQVDSTLLSIQQTHEEFVRAYTRELKYLAVDVAEKIMLQRIEENDLSLNALVMQAISAVKHSKWLTVEVSEHLVHLVDYLREELNKPEYHGRAEVEPLACSDDTCRVVTEDGTIVSTITVQTENLREAFSNAERE